MALGRDRDRASGSGMRAIALVVDAEPPVAWASRWGGGGKGLVSILVDTGQGKPVSVARKLRLSEDRWLVPGMEIPVSIDPAQPQRFEVEWDAIPSIEQRVAANDPALVDPVGALSKVSAALASAGVTGTAYGLPTRGMAGAGAGAAPSAERLRQALEEAAGKPAPPGKQRAVVLLAAVTVPGDTSGGEPTNPGENGPP